MVCDESSELGLDMLLSKYAKDINDIVEFHANTNTNPSPCTVTQSKLDKLFQPTVSLGLGTQLDNEHNYTLHNTCMSTAKYIQEPCQAINSKSLNQDKLMCFKKKIRQQQEVQAQALWQG